MSESLKIYLITLLKKPPSHYTLATARQVLKPGRRECQSSSMMTSLNEFEWFGGPSICADVILLHEGNIVRVVTSNSENPASERHLAVREYSRMIFCLMILIHCFALSLNYILPVNYIALCFDYD